MRARLPIACLLGIVLSGVLVAGVLAAPHDGEQPDMGTALYRSGWTNIEFSATDGRSLHYSRSDIVETQISVNGTLYRDGSQVGSCYRLVWYNMAADCATQWASDPAGSQVWVAVSTHWFYADGWLSSGFSSWQQRVH